MKNKFCFFLIPLVLLSVSCIDPDNTPVAPFTHIPLAAIWTRYTERRIRYVEEINFPLISGFKKFTGAIYSQNWEMTRVSFTRAYSNAVKPVDLWIYIELDDLEIKEIEFLECVLTANNTEYNLLNTPMENTQLTEYIMSHTGFSFTSRKYRGDFEKDKKFVTVNTEENYYYGFSLGIKKLPFDCSESDKIEIRFSMIIRNNDSGENHNYTVKYKRRYEEKTGGDENGEIWEEISADEWEKYTK